jgi:hypothetical protein
VSTNNRLRSHLAATKRPLGPVRPESWQSSLRPSCSTSSSAVMAFRERLKRCQLGSNLLSLTRILPAERLTRVYQVGAFVLFKGTYRPFPWLESHFACSIGKCCVDATSCPVKLRGLARIRSISFCKARRTTSERVACSHFANSRASAIMSSGMLTRPRGVLMFRRKSE